MKEKDKILIIGGYGTVGSIVSEQLASAYPSKVIIGGRNKLKADEFIHHRKLEAKSISIDINSDNFEEVDFDQVHTAISCIETMNTSFILDCILYKVNYTEIGTSFRVHQRFFGLLDYINDSDVLIIPSVGLVPGLSNIIAFNEAKKFVQIEEIHTFVMLGIGESYGLDSVRFMISNAMQTFKIKTVQGLLSVKGFTKPKSTRLLNEAKKRTFYLFDFSDHHISRILIRTNAIDTRLNFDSKAVTYVFYILQRLGFLRWAKYLKPTLLKKILDQIKKGTEIFGLQVEISGKDTKGKQVVHKSLVTGEKEAFATGLVTSYAAKLLYENTTRKGLKHIEEICDFDVLKTILKQYNIQILNDTKHESYII